MSINQLCFAMASLMLTLFGLGMAGFKYYLDAKLDPIGKNVEMLAKYMTQHESKIARLEERTKEM